MEYKTEAIRVLTSVCLQYCRQDPALFFAQLELEFEMRGISNQKQNYHLAASKLPYKAMLEVREIIFSPPKEKPYTRLRDELIRRTLMSQQKKSQFLHEETALPYSFYIDSNN